MSTTDVLRRAKEMLTDEARWNRNGSFYCGTRVCAVGAIARAGGVDYLEAVHHPATVALAHAIGSVGWVGVARWNDSAATHEELIAAFDHALVAEASNVAETPAQVAA